jgi:Tat protein translocase TatB subunit
MGPEVFGVGALEALLVMVIALMVVGPQRLPEIARQAGRWYGIARRYTAEMTTDLRGALDELEEEVKADTEDLRSVREIGQDLEDITGEARPSDVDAPASPAPDSSEAPSASASTPPDAADDAPGAAGESPDATGSRPGGDDS